MATVPDAETEALLRRASTGDGLAWEALLGRHQARLRQMVAFRLDRRLAARLDPSDVVQEALADAARRLPDYLKRRPMPFYPWLRQLALDRLVDLHREHLQAQKRSVTREVAGWSFSNDGSGRELADRPRAVTSNPVGALLRAEVRCLVQTVLTRLWERDREVLVLRHLQELSTREVADALGISERAVKGRLLRALHRVRRLLDRESRDE